MQKNTTKRQDPPANISGRIGDAGHYPSKFVAQSKLQSPLGIDAVGTDAECVVSDARVGPAEGMAIEGVGKFNLENQHMRLKDGSALDQRKIFVVVSVTSPCCRNSRQVAK